MNEISDPYACLNLELPSNLTRKKQAENRVLPTPGDWSIFTNPNLPLVIDVGCGSGQWCLRAAYEEHRLNISQKRNYLGLEIRKGLVHTATSFTEQLLLEGSVGFWHGDVNSEYWKTHVASYPGDIVLFCVQLPDPRLKHNVKHTRKLLTKDRILQPSLCTSVVDSMACNGVVYASSDYEQVANEMYDTLLQNTRLSHTVDVQDLIVLTLRDDMNNQNDMKQDTMKDATNRKWLHRNPFGIPTEREIRLQSMPNGGRDVFRVAFVSNRCFVLFKVFFSLFFVAFRLFFFVASIIIQ